MTRNGKHASPLALARLSVGELRSRKALKIGAHVAGCEQCTELSERLDAIPAALADAAYPVMPATAALRIEMALRDEARLRLATTPVTEADRSSVLPGRRRVSTQRGWQLPGLSVRATRLVGAAAAVVVAAVGSYAVATNVGGPPAAPSSNGAAAAPAAPQQMSLGPDVTYGQPGALHTIHSVVSSANFSAAHLKTDVIDAVHAAEARGASAAQPSVSTSAPSPSGPQNEAAGSAAQNGPSPTQLSTCVDVLAPDRAILLIDVAKYDGKPATIIVAASTATEQAEVWVVGAGCSATSADVLAHAALGHL